MRRWALVVCLGAGVVATPAAAAWKLQEPSPCDRVIPTGLPLPRQGDAKAINGILMYGSETTTWKDKPVGLIGKDEPVTILKECGRKLRVRNVRGVEGWVDVVAVNGEYEAYAKAYHRKPETPSDCDLLIVDRVVAQRCKDRFAALASAKQAHDDELKDNPNWTTEQLKRFLSDRTLIFSRRDHPHVPPAHDDLRYYFSRDGEVFESGPEDTNSLRDRDTVDLSGDMVCGPHTFPCARLRKVGDQLIWATVKSDTEYLVTTEEGDPEKIEQRVEVWQPKPRAPAAPAGNEDIAGPGLGR